MDFAALLSAAARNAKKADRAVAKLDSVVEAEKRKKMETVRKEFQKERVVMKKPSTQLPSFKIPRKEEKKETQKVAAPLLAKSAKPSTQLQTFKASVASKDQAKAAKVTMRVPSFSVPFVKRDQPKGTLAPSTKPPAPLPSRPQTKATHPPRKHSQYQPILKSSENKPESRKRPAVDFTNLMKMASDVSQGKKADEPKQPPRKTPKLTEIKKSLASDERAALKPYLPLLQKAVLSSMEKKPEHKLQKKTTTVSQRNAASDLQRFKEAIAKRHNKETHRKNEYSDEDDDMSDFIDDDVAEDFDQEEMAEALRAVNRKYDTDKWRHREKTISERHMTSDYRTIAREEAQSARLGRLEDAIEMKRRGTRAV